MSYLITFTCYGTHLHGDERGSVDPAHNCVGAPLRAPERALRRFEQREMKEPPYQLDAQRRDIVLRSIVEVCRFRGWALFAAHVRENHVHIVVDGDGAPEIMMDSFKQYASRALNASGVDLSRLKRWTRHGSTRRLYDEAGRKQAIQYVVEKQGMAMAVYVWFDQRAP